MEKHSQPDALDRALTSLYCADVPEGCRARWREAIVREEKETMKTKGEYRPLWRVALPVAAALVLVVGAIAAGNLVPTIVSDTLSGAPLPALRGSASVGEDTAAEMDFMAAAPMAEAGYGGTATFGSAGNGADSGGTAADTAAQTGAQTGAKIVRTADLTLATSTFDLGSQALQALTQELGGYVASLNVSGEASERMDRVAYYSLRIPGDKLDAFLARLQSVGRITARYETATDMTTQYADTALRLSTQQQKLARLQQLLGQASDVSDLLEIENEIANTQYQLDSLESSLRTIDRDVANSAVSVTLLEQSAGDTAQATELTLWQRIGSGFEASLRELSQFGQNLLVFLAMLLPALVPLAALALLIWLGYRAWRKRNAPPVAPMASQPAPRAPAADAAAEQAPDASAPKDEPPADGRE